MQNAQDVFGSLQGDAVCIAGTSRPGENVATTQPLRYAINTSLDGCCNHEAGLPPDAKSMAFWTDELLRADILRHGRVTYEPMEGAWRRPESGEWPDWMDDREAAFSEVMDPMRKAVASGTLDAVDWNAKLVGGDVVDVIRRLKEQPGRGMALGGVQFLQRSRLIGSSTSTPSSCVLCSQGADHASSMASGIRSTSSS